MFRPEFQLNPKKRDSIHLQAFLPLTSDHDVCQDFQLWEEEDKDEGEEEEKGEKIVNNPSTLCSSILTVEEETWTKGL